MKKIVLVEDNPDNRLLFSAILCDIYDIEEFESGIDALNRMKISPPDLILMDISLPNMDGIEVLKKFRKDDAMSQIPIIALTAHAMAGDKEKFLELGFNDYISKPIIDETVLLNSIEKLI